MDFFFVGMLCAMESKRIIPIIVALFHVIIVIARGNSLFLSEGKTAFLLELIRESRRRRAILLPRRAAGVYPRHMRLRHMALGEILQPAEAVGRSWLQYFAHNAMCRSNYLF